MASESNEPASTTRSAARGHERRRVLRGAAIVGAAGASVPFVAACGSDGAGENGGGENGGGENGGGENGAGENGGGEDGGVRAEPGEQLATTAEVTVGGGVILKDKRVVVAQPTEGTFKAYTAICTHKQCVVSKVTENTITCDCHQSQFSTTDGSVVSPPADRPLTEVEITVEGDRITRA